MHLLHPKGRSSSGAWASSCALAQHIPAWPSMDQYSLAWPSTSQHDWWSSGAAGQPPGELPGEILPPKFLSVQFHQGHCRRCGLWLFCVFAHRVSSCTPPVCVCTAQALVVTAGQKLSAACDAAVISNRRHKLEQINLNQIQFLAQSPRSRCQRAPTIN